MADVTSRNPMEGLFFFGCSSNRNKVFIIINGKITFISPEH